MHSHGIYEDEIVGKAYDRKLLLRFAAYLRPYLWLVVAVLCILPLTTAAKLAQPWLIKLAIDNHIVKGDLAGLPAVARYFLLLILAESLLSFFEVWLLQYLGQRVMQDIRLELFTHVQRLSTSFFDRTPTGSLVTRLTNDVEVLGEMFAAGIITVVGDIMLLAGIIGVMLWMNLHLSLVTFAVLPLLFWIAFTFRRKMRNAFRQVRSRLANLNVFLSESINGMTLIQLFNRQEQEQQEFTRLNGSYRDANLPVITWDASLYAAVEALSSVAVGLLVWYGSGEILAGALTFGALVAFIQYIEKFFAPIRDLSAKYSVMQGAMAALERLFNLLDCREILPEPLPSPLSVAQPENDKTASPLPMPKEKGHSMQYAGIHEVRSGLIRATIGGRRFRLAMFFTSAAAAGFKLQHPAYFWLGVAPVDTACVAASLAACLRWWRVGPRAYAACRSRCSSRIPSQRSRRWRRRRRQGGFEHLVTKAHEFRGNAKPSAALAAATAAVVSSDSDSDSSTDSDKQRQRKGPTGHQRRQAAKLAAAQAASTGAARPAAAPAAPPASAVSIHSAHVATDVLFSMQRNKPSVTYR